MTRPISTVLFVLLAGSSAIAQDAPFYKSELIFPFRTEHNHAPGLVECPNGDLICSWYRGSGERSSDDVAVYGARLRKGQSQWSEAFLMADYPGFPDCNTCMMIDSDNRLWLFWPLILSNTWESAVTHYLYSHDYTGDGTPKWDWHGAIYLKPADFKGEFLKQIDELVAKLSPEQRARIESRKESFDVLKGRLGDKLYQRLGWQPRCKPTFLAPSDRLPHGRVLLPLYSDTFSVGIMAVSDNKGRTWYASKPLLGFGAIQPTVLQKSDGTLVAYMRENGWTKHIRVSESKDDGITWGPVGISQLPNPGAGIDAVRLADGHWCLVYNDTARGRNSLAVSISDDEGKTWRWTRHLEKHERGAYHYPCVIQARDATIHAVYSDFVPKALNDREGKSMKHVAFNETWVTQGDP